MAKKNKSNDLPNVSSRLVQAIGHPVRVRMLERLATETASAKQLSISLEVSLGVASYHLRRVLDKECGLVEVVATRQRRGAIETFYRLDVAAMRDAVTWKHLNGPVGQAVKDSVVQCCWNLVLAAQRAGLLGMDPTETLSCRPVAVDTEGWTQVNSALARAEEEISKALEKSAQRLRSGGEAMQVVVGLIAFHAVQSPPS